MAAALNQEICLRALADRHVTQQQTIPARRVAVNVLNQCDPRRAYASTILNELVGKTDQKQRATDLVLGTLRNRPSIDTAITAFSGRPIKNIPNRLLNVIRVAAYELIYNPQAPDYSVVNEAVNISGHIAGKKQVGFVNAVLRQITRRIINRSSSITDSDQTRTLPQTPQTGCLFDTSFLPDPDSSPKDYLSIAFSLPYWLVAQWLENFGFQESRKICLGSNRKPSLYFRPNSLKTTNLDLINTFTQAGIDVEPAPNSSMLAIKSPKSISQLPGFNQGLFSVQDITASQPVIMLNPQPDWRILDLCAAPGAKTTQMAEVTAGKASIVATDIDPKRLEMVRENAKRLEIESLTVVGYEDLPAVAQQTGPFEAILLDVPCSNTGVLAKRVEVRYRLTPNAVRDLAAIQSDLLSTSATMLAPTGRICYSTCSILKAENAEIVRNFLSAHDDFKLECEQITLPSAEAFDHDGGYIAILTRQS